MARRLTNGMLTIWLCFVALTAQAQQTPTMGWSSWNTYRVNISDSLIIRQAKALVSLGLSNVGYRYVNIDDGYFGGRDANGQLFCNARKFPRGMKAVADGIHCLGLKAGIYSDAGDNTCGYRYDNDSLGQGVGLYGHEQQDADLFFRQWGYDFIKIDYCGGQNLGLDECEQYTRIRQAIDRAGRKDVRINVCRWAFPGTWVSRIGSSWRIFADIRPNWRRVRDIIMQNLYMSAYAVGGHFNDMDMLEVGRGMTAEEDQTHFALWCIMSSPLLIGCDLTTIKPATLSLLKNCSLIAINQDSLCLQAQVAARQDSVFLLAKDMGQRWGHHRAFAVVNLSDRTQQFMVDFPRMLCLQGNIRLRNLITGTSQTLDGPTMRLSLPPHASRVFTVTARHRLPQLRWEAEQAWLNSYQALTNDSTTQTVAAADASGGRYVCFLGGTADRWMEWRDVAITKGGQRRLTIRYKTKEPRLLEATVNGESTTIRCPASPGFRDIRLKVRLRQGLNTIRLGNSLGAAPDIDYIEIR